MPWTGEKYGSFSLAENSAKCLIALVWPQFENGGSEKCSLDYLDINVLASISRVAKLEDIKFKDLLSDSQL